MIESLLQISYDLADTYWLGNMGEKAGMEALAATQVSWPLVWLMVSVGSGFGVAAIALISQHTGAKQHKEAEVVAGQVFFFMLVFSTIVAIVGFLISPMLLRSILPDSPEVAAKGTVFMRTIFISQPFMFTFMAFAFILRAWGDTVTPMIISAVTVTLNIILDPLFIYGVGPIPQWGIFGAALATLLTRALAASVAIYLLFRGKVGIKLNFDNIKPDFGKLKKLFRIGAPASIGNSGTAFGFVAVMFIVARVNNSDAALAAYNAGDRILGVMFVLMGGLAIAMSTMIGQNLGAGQVERAQEVVKKGMMAIGGLMGVFTIILFFLARDLIIIFNQNPDVVEIGASFLLIFSLSMPFFGLFRASNAVFEGSGQTKYMMALDLLRLWGLRVPLAFVFALVLGFQSSGVWIGMALSNVISAIAAILVLRTGKWKTTVIEEKAVIPKRHEHIKSTR